MTEQREIDQSDIEFVRAVANGDERALASLYDRYSSILFGLLIRILHRRAEAEDVLQEVFIQIWQKAPDYDESRGRPFSWLVTIARSRAIDRLRSLDARERLSTAAALEAPETARESADDEAIRHERREIVQTALDQLSEPQRQTLLLAYLEGLSQSEIAMRLNEPLGTIKTRTRSGLKKMHDILRKNMNKLR